MTKDPDIQTIAEYLISIAYPELKQSRMTVSWGKISSYAQIQWTEYKETITLKMNKSVKKWHNASITGLIAHELSHPAQNNSGLNEQNTDTDAIERGFGPYLAIERLYAGKYDDHIIQRGKDRYLGYRTIRQQLTHLEKQQLDLSLSKIGLIPQKMATSALQSHDVILHTTHNTMMITIEGHEFILPEHIKNPDIKLLVRDRITQVYANEILVGEFPVADN